MSQEDSKVHFFPHFAMRSTHFTMVSTCTVLLNTGHRMFSTPSTSLQCLLALPEPQCNGPPFFSPSALAQFPFYGAGQLGNRDVFCGVVGTNSGLVVLQILFAVFFHVPSCFGWLSHLAQPVFICFWGVDTSNQMVFWSRKWSINRGAGLTSDDLCVGTTGTFPHFARHVRRYVVTFWPKRSLQTLVFCGSSVLPTFCCSQFHRNQPQQWSGCDKPQRVMNHGDWNFMV